MVLGSGRTWPHDFRFFTGFFSDAGVDGAVVSVVSVEVGTFVGEAVGERAANAIVSGLDSAEKGGGVIMSMGFIVFVEDVPDVVNNDGYISPGVERKDSAGDASNFTTGEACSSQVAILDRRIWQRKGWKLEIAFFVLSRYRTGVAAEVEDVDDDLAVRHNILSKSQGEIWPMSRSHGLCEVHGACRLQRVERLTRHKHKR